MVMMMSLMMMVPPEKMLPLGLLSVSHDDDVPRTAMVMMMRRSGIN